MSNEQTNADTGNWVGPVMCMIGFILGTVFGWQYTEHVHRVVASVTVERDHRPAKQPLEPKRWIYARTNDGALVQVLLQYGVWELPDSTDLAATFTIQIVAAEHSLAELCRMAQTYSSTKRGWTDLDTAIESHATLTSRVLNQRVIGPIVVHDTPNFKATAQCVLMRANP